jgi:hypothetical protein
MRSFLDEVTYEDKGRRLILTMCRESGEEKRKQPRLEATQPVRIAPIRADGSVDWEAAYAAVSHNLSEQGIGLLQERLAATDRIIIGIYSKDQPIYIPAEVRHCRSVGGDIVELGCRFQTHAEIPSAVAAAVTPQVDAEQALQEAIQRLVDRQMGPWLGDDERRTHPRVVFNRRVELLRASSPQPVIGFARDLSKGGVAFVSTVALAEEPVIIILPQEDGPPLRVRGRIVRCNKIEEGFYDAGASFLQLAETPQNV